MDVKKKSLPQIIKEHLWFIPSVLVALCFYCLVMVVGVDWLLQNLSPGGENVFQKQGMLLGFLLFVLMVSAYIGLQLKLFWNYRLALQDNHLHLKGMAGWKAVDVQLPVNNIKQVFIGEPIGMSQAARKWMVFSAKFNAQIGEHVLCRLYALLDNGKVYRVDAVVTIFERESLYQLILHLDAMGIATNVMGSDEAP